MSGTIDHVNVDLVVNSLLTKALDLSLPADLLAFTTTLRLSNGTTTGLASQQWHDQRTLTASATEDLDLAGGLTNAFGVTLTFVTVKFLYVKASTANTNSVIVSRKATTGIPIFDADGDSITLGPGEWFCYGSPTTGKTITPTTDDTLTLTNSAGSTSVIYDIVIVGTD